MARFLVYLLLGFCILSFTTDVNAEEEEGESGDNGEGEDSGEEEDSGEGEEEGGDEDVITITIGPLTITIPADIGCVSGDMKVEEQTKGVVNVSQLTKGDVIYGMTGAKREPAWCKVVAIFPAAGGRNTTTHDGFTADHMVIDFTVHPYGNKGEVRKGPIYTLVTECDASINSLGQAFTPISTAFCPHELSWSEYITLMSAIRRVADQTGYFWFDTSAYHDNKSAMVPHWFDQLHQLCHELLLCSREDRCQGFENVMKEFVHEHLNKQYAEIVERVFPNMGHDVNKQQAGTIAEAVRPQQGSSHIVLFSTLGSAMVVLLIIAATVLVYRMQMKKKKAEKELPFQSDANHSDVKA